MRKLIIVALALAGCIYERPYVADEAPVPAPPPPAADSYAYADQTPPPPPAGSEIADEDVFYGSLSPYGSWTMVAPYGRVWVPSVAWGWRPYYYGRWVLTDWGWTFVSDDPWGWAAYHYGRWNFGVGIGWYWIPGRIWGPAWVSWRYGGGYAAWCPLGPSGVVFAYNHPAWVAVSEQHFTQPIPRAAVTGSAAMPIVTQRTQPLPAPRAGPRAGAFGPPVAGIQRAVGQPIPRVAAAQAIRPRPAPSAAPAPMRAAGDPMRSPASPRVRAGAGGDVPHAAPSPGPVGRPQPYTGAPRAAPARPGGGPAPTARPGGGAPRSGGGMRQAAPAPAPQKPAPHPRARGSEKK